MQIEGEPFVREDLFGGRGKVRIWDMLGGQKIDPFTVALACELEPAGSVGTHVQQEFPEIVVCVEGRGRATLAGRSAPGKTVVSGCFAGPGARRRRPAARG